ncbi:MAG: sugar-binding transcriptional regulator [Lactobacillus amylovorus]
MNRLVNNNQNIGISWGQALAETVSHLKKRSLNKVTIIPLVGGPSNTNNQNHINSLVHEFAHKTNGDSLFINASAVSKNKQTFDKTISSQQFRQIQSYWTKLDIAFVGIGGTLSKTNSLWRDLLTDQDIDFLKQSDVIGDCCCRFIDKHGKIVSSNLNKRTIAIPFPTFLNIPERIGIARGKSKISAIRTVLDNEYLTGLVTDAETASALIK